MRRFFVLLIMVFVQIFSLLPIAVLAEDGTLDSNVEIDGGIVISRFQASGSTSGTSKSEFVEIYNNSAEDIEITEWCLLYNANTTTPILCFVPEEEAVSYFITARSSVLVMASELELSLQTAEPDFAAEMLFSATTNLATTNGSLSVVNQEGTVVDMLGWGSGAAEGTATAGNIPAGKILQRLVASNETDTLQLQDTNNNSEDFELTVFDGSYTTSGLYEVETELPETEEFLPNCEEIVLSEVLPNALGADAGKEFIELFNPTSEDIDLKGCALELSSEEQYVFTDEVLLAGAYHAYFDSQTGLVLPNAAGGSITLVQGNTELNTLTYPPDMSDDESWVLFSGVWQRSLVLTPGAENQLPLPEVVIIIDEEELAACPEGKFRNPETNRCKNIETATSSLTPCAAYQVRNPETNRCRSIVSLVSSLVPCKAGQERNPETNRCRNVAGANTTRAECQEGYERNSETNRCRKVAVATAPSPSVGSGQNLEGNRLNTAFLVAASVAALGYGAYEYRRDIMNVRIKLLAWAAAKRAVK
jgi:hypothetical protein